MAEIWTSRPLGDLVDNYDSQRIPVAGTRRSPGPFPYYGASGIVDYVSRYIFEGEYLLVGEDGENLRSRSTPIAFMANGKFWVNNHAHILRARGGIADTRFLKHALNLADLSGFLSGSAQPKLSQAALNSIPISIPPLPEQRAIAEVLGALDDKIAANRDIESLSLSLIHAYYFSALQEGSEIRPALDALSVTFGEAFKGEWFTPSGTGRPLLRIRDISARKSEVWTAERRAGETLVQPGEIVAGMDADFTASAWLGQPSLLNQRVCRITSPWGNAWALSMAQPLLSGITMQKSGTTVIHLNKSDLARSTVRVPTGPSAITMAQAAQGLLERLVVAAQESSTLAELRDTLLPALMDGTLRVKDAERTVGEAL